MAELTPRHERLRIWIAKTKPRQDQISEVTGRTDSEPRWSRGAVEVKKDPRPA